MTPLHHHYLVYQWRTWPTVDNNSMRGFSTYIWIHCCDQITAIMWHLLVYLKQRKYAWQYAGAERSKLPRQQNLTRRLVSLVQEPRQTHFCSFRNYWLDLSTPLAGDGHLEAKPSYTSYVYFNRYYHKLMKATLRQYRLHIAGKQGETSGKKAGVRRATSINLPDR